MDGGVYDRPVDRYRDDDGIVPDFLGDAGRNPGRMAFLVHKDVVFPDSEGVPRVTDADYLAVLVVFDGKSVCVIDAVYLEHTAVLGGLAAVPAGRQDCQKDYREKQRCFSHFQ